MASERWWAPQRPTIEPDAVVLTLLRPDDNGKSDLGTTLLAVHRAGAAACETVARGAVPSSGRLLAALAESRAQFAPVAVDAVAKNLEVTYAGLLVRDVLSEAESATLALYNAAVSKGVSPPLAAQRAGAVYGVPARELGRYMALASDPKANPVAVTDLADRTLLGYVSKLADAEREDPGRMVTFAKAPVLEWDPDEHPRDQQGQFSRVATAVRPTVSAPRPGSIAWIRERVGLGDASPARVAEVATAPAQPATRLARTHRKQRTHRTQAAPEHQAQRQATRQLSRQATRKALQRADGGRTLAQIEAQQKHMPVVDLSPDLLRIPRPNEDRAQYGTLSMPVAFVLDNAAGASMMRQMADQSGQFENKALRMFRLGQVSSRATAMDLANSDTVSKGVYDAADATWHAAANPDENGGVEYEPPNIETIHPDEAVGLGEYEFHDHINRRRLEMAREVFRKPFPSDAEVEAEKQYVKALEEYRPFGSESYDDMGHLSETPDIHLVHYRETNPATGERNIPTVYEFVIAGGAQGSYEGGRGQEELKLDPNQAYRVRGRPELFYDKHGDAVVQRIFLTRVEDWEVDEELGRPADYGKALATAERVQFEQLHPRDELGQFASAAEHRKTTLAPTAFQHPRPAPAQPRTHRVARTHRAQRAHAETAPIPTTTPERVLSRSVQRTVQRQAMLAAREAELTQDEPDLPEISDARQFKILRERDFNQIMDLLGDDVHLLQHEDVEVPLHGVIRGMLEGLTVHRASGMRQTMSWNVDADITDRGEESVVLGSIPVAMAHDEMLVKTISDAFAKGPQYDRIELVLDPVDKRYVTLHANKNPAGRQMLIEFDPFIDWRRPVSITLVGKYRARDVALRSEHTGSRESLVDISDIKETGEGTVPNPRIHLFRVSSPHVSRFLATNE